MTLTVSVSELRNNISSYLEKVTKGTRVLIRDEKKFDKAIYEKVMQKAAGILTSKNHPEWKTKSNVISWVTKSRLSDKRSF